MGQWVLGTVLPAPGFSGVGYDSLPEPVQTEKHKPQQYSFQALN